MRFLFLYTLVIIGALVFADHAATSMAEDLQRLNTIRADQIQH